MTTRVGLIVNPVAARYRPQKVKRIQEVLESGGARVALRLTEGQGHAEQLAQDLLPDIDVLAVYGGDGTVMQAVGNLVTGTIPLAVIPGGTGNLLASNLGVPRDVKRAAANVLTGAPRAIDLGRVIDGDRTRYFAVACGAGYDAELMAGTNGPAKRRFGMAAYVAWVTKSLARVRPYPFSVTIDGDVRTVEATMVLVANCNKIMPPLLTLGPSVSLDDGILDVVTLRARGLFEACAVVLRLVARRGDGGGVRRMRGRDITISAMPPRPKQLDGDTLGVTPLEVHVVPGGLSVLVPERSMPAVAFRTKGSE